MTYLNRVARRPAPQSAPIPGSNQVANSAGGFAWAIDCWARLRRFLILGSEGGSHYAGEWKLSRENAGAVEACIAEDGVRAVAEIVGVSDAGRAPKNDPAIFALAMAAGSRDEPTRKAALEALPRMCRTSTHLFQFATFVEAFRGWGRSLRRAIGGRYASRSAESLVVTDSETRFGRVHPAQALERYRRESGIDARLAVVGMVSNGFSIADPNDPGMLDVVGFDTATPQLVSDFARGAL